MVNTMVNTMYIKGHDHHPVILRGLNIENLPAAYERVPNKIKPLILERTDQAFIDVLISELATESFPLNDYAKQKPDNYSNGTLKLYQPIHKIFNIILFEVVCDRFGEPRLNPQDIESAGIVVRRRNGKEVEAWVSEKNRFRGWVPVNDKNGLTIDPEPQFRYSKLRTGNQQFDSQLSEFLPYTDEALVEHSTSLFVAPPEICELRGKTILYAMIPVASSDFSEAAPPPLPTDGGDDFKNSILMHLTTYLRRPRQKEAKITALPFPNSKRNYLAADEPKMRKFMTNLRQLAIEFDAFGENKALFNLLNQLQVTGTDAGGDLYYRPVGDFLREAYEVLLVVDDAGKKSSLKTFRMAHYWPEITEDIENDLLAIILDTVQSRSADIYAGISRYGERNRNYFAQGFIRVKQPGNCPPVTTWSKPSENFKIADWFDSSEKTPVVPIGLPDISNRDNLKNLKPNVSFQVPSNLFDLLNNNSAEDFLAGDASQGGSFGLDWICSFSIPIITLCAFIVLNIFLSLFDLIFRWLLYIKVCIPIPKGIVSD